MCLGVHTQRGSFGTTFRVGRVVDSGTQAKKGERCATRTSFVTRRWTVDGDGVGTVAARDVARRRRGRGGGGEREGETDDDGRGRVVSVGEGERKGEGDV